MDFFSGFDLQTFIRTTALSIVPFLFAITVHEAMHGFVAYRLGDPTAKLAGRLTLNPLAHIDPLGLLFLLITRMFGWAKPVPVNYYMIKHKYGVAMVSAAGPLSNLALAVISVIIFHIFALVADNFAIPQNILYPISMMIAYSIQINIALFVFNLIPILPLDGGRILYNFLPRDLAMKYESTERYGFIIILLLFVTGAIQFVLSPTIIFIYSILI